MSCKRLTEVQFAPYLLLFFNYLFIDRPIKLLKQNKQIIAHIAEFLHTRGVRHRLLEVSPCYGSFQTAQGGRRSGDYALSGLNLLASEHVLSWAFERIVVYSLNWNLRKKLLLKTENKKFSDILFIFIYSSWNSLFCLSVVPYIKLFLFCGLF